MIREDFGKLTDGRNVSLYTVENGDFSFSVTDYGATLVSFVGPDKKGFPTDVILGFDDVSSYENNGACIGSTVGRYANRIANACFTIDGNTYTLPKNDGTSCIHGGHNGFAYRMFSLERYTDNSLTFSRVSPDGEEGFPGNLSFSVTFTLTDIGELSIAYSAVSDKDTMVSFTNHAYFNPSGIGSVNSNNDLFLTINASSFCECDNTCLATGNILPVTNTAFDFRTPKKIGPVLEQTDFEPLINGKGIDHNFVLSLDKSEMKFAASLYSVKSGIEIQCFTDQFGIQIYSANFLDNIIGKRGQTYGKHGAVCMETQSFPNAPHINTFPSSLLRSNEQYSRTTIYKFNIK